MIAITGMVVGGLILLAVGADYFVRGAVALARTLGISMLVIGLTVVAFGTSLPELLVGLNAALSGATGIAIGNVVGSNIANILLILGAAAIITPVHCTRRTLYRDGMAMLGATALFIAFAMLGTLGIWHGAIALCLLGSYLYACYLADRKSDDCLSCEEADEVAPVAGSTGKIILITICGLIGVIAGSELLVRGATELARALGVSEETIGLTIVALGTSVPELATTVAAARRRHADVALGNVLGSNLFNLLCIMGAITLVVPIDLAAMAPKIASFDLWAMLAVTIIIVPLLATGGRLSRREGGILIMAYAAFIAAQFFGIGGAIVETAAR